MRIEAMNLKSLSALKAKVEAAIVARKAIERDNLRKAIEKTCAESGFAVSEIIGARSRKSGKIAPKYVNGKGETWTGRGRRPRWLEAELKKGAKLEAFAI